MAREGLGHYLNQTNTMHFLVHLTMRIGEYTKHADHLIEADTEAEAEEQALEDESHHWPEAGYGRYPAVEDDEWGDGDMVYLVDSVKTLTAFEASCLERLLSRG